MGKQDPVGCVNSYNLDVNCVAASRNPGVLMFGRRILIARCSSAMRPLRATLSLRLLEDKMSRVLRSLALYYGKPQGMEIQTIEQQFSSAEKNGNRCDVERVDQAGS